MFSPFSPLPPSLPISPQELDDNLSELTRQFEAATAAKLKCQQEAEATARTISLANRLVGGLASEKVRWAVSVEKFREEEKTLAGDVLLTSAYLSYVGCFSRNYRVQLFQDKWMPFLRSLQVSTYVLMCVVMAAGVCMAGRKDVNDVRSFAGTCTHACTCTLHTCRMDRYVVL